MFVHKHSVIFLATEKGHCQSEKNEKQTNTHTELFPRQSWVNLRDRVENLWAFESAQTSY